MACNILDEANTTQAVALEQRIRDIARDSGGDIQHSYRIGADLTHLVQQAESLLS